MQRYSRVNYNYKVLCIIPNCRCYTQYDWYTEVFPTSTSPQTNEECIPDPLLSSETTVIYMAEDHNVEIWYVETD